MDRRFFRFAVSGGITTGVDFVLYMLLSLRVNIVAAKLVSMGTASVISFCINKRWTFADRERVTAEKVAAFILVQLVNITVNTAVNTVLYRAFGQKLPAFVCATGAAMVVNFLLQRRLVFVSREKDKLAIFDLDGTLFDTQEVNFHAYEEAAEKYGFHLDHDYFCLYCNGKYYKDFLPAVTTDDEGVLERMHEEKKRRYASHLEKARPNVHLIRIARKLKKDYYLAVVTTASGENCRELLGRFGILGLFDLILTKEDVERVKPDPEGFVRAMESFGVSGDDTLVFEDSPEGIEAARRAGAHCMVVGEYVEGERLLKRRKGKGKKG